MKSLKEIVLYDSQIDSTDWQLNGSSNRGHYLRSWVQLKKIPI